MNIDLFLPKGPEDFESFGGNFRTIQWGDALYDPLDGGNPLIPPPTKPGYPGS